MATVAGVMAGASYLKNINDVVSQGMVLLDKGTVTDTKSETILVHCKLAASFGKLNKESVKTMEEDLKVMIAGTQRALGKLTDLSWENVVSCMMQNAILEPMADSIISRSDKLVKHDRNVFKLDGSPCQPIVNEVQSWFVKLISDPDVLDDTKIDITILGEIVASSGAKVDSLQALFAKNEYAESTVVDVGILRYPDIDNPYFKLYRIQIKAWSGCERVLIVQLDRNGITGEFRCMKFKPRASAISKMRADVKKKAIAEAEAIFD